jgi:tetrapyrrole methylase family protein / MazG family protein
MTVKKKGTGRRANRGEKRKVPRQHTVADLLDIMARLRGPSGCPWDKKQTPHTLRAFLMEEAYETLEAIEAGDPESLKEELGDLLLQIVFLSRIAEEKGSFRFSDVVHTLAEKLVRRHPHVFRPAGGHGRMPKDARDVVTVWRVAKELEGKYAERTSLLDGIPLALPALERARRLLRRVSRIGSGWPTSEAATKRVREGLEQINRPGPRSSRKNVEIELGDLLFALVIWAGFKDISPEEALRKANRRFMERFRRIELELRRRGAALEETLPEEMDPLWGEAEKAKKNRRGPWP